MDLTVILAFVTGILAVVAIGLGEELRRERLMFKDLSRSYDLALNAAARADERATETAKIHQELLARPVQALIPANSVEVLGQMIIQYLNDGSMGAPVIFPTKKGPIQ
jgi:hypothetical protein